VLELLNFHKIDAQPVNPSKPNENYTAECPFCGSLKMHINIEKQLWDCKKGSCGKFGNHLTLITELHRKWLDLTTAEMYESLSQERSGITATALQEAGFAYDTLHHRWLVPYQNGSEYLNNLGAFNPKAGFTIFKSPGLPLKLYRPMNKADADLEDTIIVFEGEWDLLALHPHIPEGYSSVSVPGALTFKQEFIPVFQGRHVILAYDKDDAGKAGIAKAVRLLNHVAESIQYLQWPEDFKFPDAGNSDKPGKDIRDLVAHLS